MHTPWCADPTHSTQSCTSTETDTHGVVTWLSGTPGTALAIIDAGTISLTHSHLGETIRHLQHLHHLLKP